MLSTDSIVAGSGTASLKPVRIRLALAVIALVLMAAFGLVRALMEPSTGWRLDVDAQQRVQAIELAGSGRLENVQSVRGINCQGTAMQVPLTADLMRETGGIAKYYSEHNTFYAAHAQLWTLISCSASAGQPLHFKHAEGEMALELSPKAWSELGLRFWFPWIFGVLAFSVGLAVWVYRPVDRSASWYLVASSCYAFWVMVVSAMGSRLLTHPSLGLQALHLACHLAGHLYVIGLCMLIWRFPASLDRPRLRENGLMWSMLAWAGIFMLIDVMQWVPTINFGFRLPNLVLVIALAVLFATQWRASRKDPLRRAPLKWLGFLLLITLSLAFLTTLFALANKWTAGRMAYGFAPMSLIFIGFVPLVTRLNLFRLELWWTRAWLWFLGGVLVMVLDALLAHWLVLDGSASLGLALALAGWLYFPVRQWLWQRFSLGALPATSEVLPAIVALSAPHDATRHARNDIWQSLWERQFLPQNIRELPTIERLDVQAQGQLLHIPAIGILPALELGMPMRGTRLFNLADLQRANEVFALTQRSLEAHDALEQGARLERQRIAADLHDDLGAKLLTIVQTARDPERGARVVELARQALEDMRLAVRGLSVNEVLASEAQADWRAELLQRLEVAGIHAQWESNDAPAAFCLSPTAQVQLTRIMRETISNVIRHSGAKHCQLRLVWSPTSLDLQIQDDGVGLPASQNVPGQRMGLGLSNIERRVHKLNGLLQWFSVEPHGLRMQISLPLAHLRSESNLSPINTTIIR